MEHCVGEWKNQSDHSLAMESSLGGGGGGSYSYRRFLVGWMMVVGGLSVVTKKKNERSMIHDVCTLFRAISY